MAGNGEYIEVLSSSATKDVQAINKEIDKLIANVNKANNTFKGLKFPSELKNSIAQLNNVTKQCNALLRAQLQLQERLAQVTNQNTQANNRNTQSSLEAQRVETERVRTERERLRLSEDQRRATERQERSNRLLGSAYAQLSRQEAESARRVQDLIVRGRTAEQTQRQYNRELRNAQREHQQLQQRVQAADRAVGRFYRNVGNYPTRAVNGIRDLMGAFGLVGGVTAFAMITKDIFNTTKELQSLDFATKQVVGSQVEFAQTQAFLQRISEAYGIEIMGLQRSYTQFYAASQNAIASGAITSDQIKQIFESVSKASGAMGLSVEQQQGAFLALQQMISKGNVQAEEIRGQLAERLPGAFGILAKAMGVTEIELNKLLKDGKVLAAEVLPAFAKELEKAYGVENLDRVESLAAGTTRLKNEWTDFVRELTEGESVVTGFFKGFVDGVAGALKGMKLLMQSEEEREEYLRKGVGESAYAEQMEYLKKLKEQNDGLLEVAIKDDSGESAQLKLKNLRIEREEIYKNIDALEESKNAWNTLPGTPAYFELNAALEDQNKILQRNEDQSEVVLAQWRAINDFMKQDDKIKAGDGGKAKRQKADIDYLKDVYELRKQNTENEIEAQEGLMDDERKNYAVRLEAAENYFFQKEHLLELERQEQLRLNDLNLENQKEQYQTAINEGKATYTNLRELEYQHIIRKTKINEDFENKKRKNAVESAKKLQGVLDAIEDQRQVNVIDQKQLDNIRQMNTELANVSTGTSYAKFKELEERKTKIVEDATEERIRIELRRTQAQIDALTADERDSKVYQDLRNKEIKLTSDLANAEQERLEKSTALTLELKRATDEYLKSFTESALSESGMSSLNMFLQIEENGKTMFENLMDGADGLQEKFSVAFAAISEVVQETFAFMTQNSQARFEAEYARMEQQKNIALQFAGESEAGRAEVERQYEERRREIRIREAKSQKDQALFNAIINTAQAVVAALPNIPLSVIVGTLGAAQIAMIASQPLPAYAEGGTTDKSGEILVNDAKGSNYRELIQTPDGKSFIPKGRNVIMNVPKGTKIHKAGSFDKELNDVLGHNGISQFAPTSLRDKYGDINVTNNGGLTKQDAIEAFSTALGGLAIVNNTFDENGYSSSIKKGNAKTQQLNSVKSSKGITLR